MGKGTEPTCKLTPRAHRIPGASPNCTHCVVPGASLLAVRCLDTMVLRSSCLLCIAWRSRTAAATSALHGHDSGLLVVTGLQEGQHRC